MKTLRSGGDAEPSQPNFRPQISWGAGGLYATNRTTMPNMYTTDFQSWWQLYPRKVGKRAAMKSYQRALQEIQKERDCTKIDAIRHLLEATQMFATSPKYNAHSKSYEPEFTPHPATWLNQGRWEDDPAEWGYPKRGSLVEECRYCHGRKVVTVRGQKTGKPCEIPCCCDRYYHRLKFDPGKMELIPQS